MANLRLSKHSWSTYEKWNESVADVLFPLVDEPSPKYMVIEDDELSAIAEQMERDPSSIIDALAEVVRGVAVDGNNHLNLKILYVLQDKWNRGINPIGSERFLAYPPACAFLAVAVVAAEQMGRTADHAATAYYPRLEHLLGLSEGDTHTQKQFRKYSESLWASLNRWLESLEGQRGFPSAYALRHRYVGLPLSQALLREADRRRLPEMFDHLGLTAGMQLTPEDMEKYLDAWLTNEGHSAPRHIVQMWSQPSTRERIAALAALELANWDGVLPGGRISRTTDSRVGLIAHLQRGFIGESLDLALMVKPATEFDGSAETISSDESWLPIAFFPLAGGLWRTSPIDDIEASSLLEGVVRVRLNVSGHDAEHVRRPRPVVPLVFDELQSAFLERDRLQLGVKSMVLARVQSETYPNVRPADSVAEVLKEHARPGFDRIESVVGLPSDWHLFVDVQLFSTARDSRFEELKPLASTQLTIAGGLRIPSRIRKWNTLAPPEVLASCVMGQSLTISLSTAGNSPEKIGSWSSDSGALVVNLANTPLQDGDYTVSLFIDGNGTPIQQASLRLRSSDHVDPGWALTERLAYSTGPRSAAGVLGADTNFDARYVDGPRAIGQAEEIPLIAPIGDFSWVQHQDAPKPRQQMRIGIVDPQSCAITGAHYIQLPTDYGGRRTSRFIQGTCKSCGIVKQFPSWLPRNPRRRDHLKYRAQGSDVKFSTVVDALEPVANFSEALQPAALDALMHLGGGDIRSLREIAEQIDGSSLFVNNFINHLEWLGHIAVERDTYGKPSHWEISPACAVALGPDSYLLTGFWPYARLSQLARTVCDHGGSTSASDQSGWHKGHRVEGVNLEVFVSLLDGDEFLVPDPMGDIVSVLPLLSEVAAGLARVTEPGFESLEKFEISVSRWIPAGSMNEPGAYRVRRGFERLNVFRSAEDCGSGTVVEASAIVVKHLAANDAGTTLMRYDHKEESVLLPLGCALPGMYGRATVLASGLLPQVVKIRANNASRTAHAYFGVAEGNAYRLNSLLTG